MRDGPITISGIRNSALSVGTAANVTNQVQTLPDGPDQDLEIPSSSPARAVRQRERRAPRG